MEKRKLRIFSGAQPTGNIHIGNYIGALSLWAENQDDFENIFCIVDLHALTIPEAIIASKLRNNIRECAALYMACGIDPNKSTIFVQSHIKEHSELAWILNCTTPMGWLERMTQYKSKSEKLDTVGTGLFDYPVLMAADILLYQTDVVPVGDDQKQHIEITRDIAQRFNGLFGDTFTIPKELIRESGARIMGFDDPENKMSKSIAVNKSGHAISMLDDEDTIKKTIMRATTDTNSELKFEFASAGVKNLLTLYKVLSGKSMEEIQVHFEGQGYGILKKEVLEVVLESLRPIKQKYNQILADPGFVDDILKMGMERVLPIAQNTMSKVKNNIGI